MTRAPGALLLACTLFASCRGAPPPAADVVAILGDERVVYADFDRFLLRQAGEEVAALPSAVLSRLFDQFIDERLLRRLAVEQGLASPGSSPAIVQEALLLAGNVDAEVTQAEIDEVYRTQRASYVRPERVRLRQILLDDRQVAEEAAAALAAGEPFEAVAARLSIDPAAQHGGEQGELARGELPSSFVDLVFELGEGEVSEIVSAPYGFHIFQVTAHLPSEVLEVDEVADEIREQLVRERGDHLLAERLAEARRRYSLEILAHNLPFDYTPAAGGPAAE